MRCERDGVEYREDDDFGALFRLHLDTHRRKGTPLYLPEMVFANFFAELKAAGLARLGHAVFEGKVIASQLMLTGPHAVAHTVCAGADDDYLRMGASAFLRWHGCLALARSGYAANDLTDAALNPVTRFKSQLGGELTPTGRSLEATRLPTGSSRPCSAGGMAPPGGVPNKSAGLDERCGAHLRDVGGPWRPDGVRLARDAERAAVRRLEAIVAAQCGGLG